MKNIEKYYDNTESCSPRKNVKYFVEEIKEKSEKAIELGCGAGNDTVYLIKNNWKALAIDREDVEERIRIKTSFKLKLLILISALEQKSESGKELNYNEHKIRK